MGYLILLSIGAVLGWLASIIFKEADSRAVRMDIVTGAIGAMVVGLAITASNLVDQLSATTFFYGCIGAIAGVALSKLVGRKLIDL